MIRLGKLLLTAALFSTAPALASVSIEGQVLRPGSYELAADARLSNAVIAGGVLRSAWPLGAAWLRQSELQPQTRLKAGLLFELQQAQVQVRAELGDEPAALLQRLHAQVSRMPVTGRVAADLHPLTLRLQPYNHLLAAGDRLVYPRRPEHARIMGAVEQDCQLPFDAASDLLALLRQCPPHRLADPSWVWLIQPDGRVQKLGIAGWNRETAPVAVGAVLYRPILPRWLGDAEGLNEDMAAWLATQYQLGGLFNE